MTLGTNSPPLSFVVISSPASFLPSPILTVGTIPQPVSVLRNALPGRVPSRELPGLLGVAWPRESPLNRRVTQCYTACPLPHPHQAKCSSVILCHHQHHLLPPHHHRISLPGQNIHNLAVVAILNIAAYSELEGRHLFQNLPSPFWRPVAGRRDSVAKVLGYK